MKNKLIYILVAGIALSLATGCSKVQLPDPPVYSPIKKIAIDLSKEQQTIDGFGASDAWRAQMVGEYWPEAKKKQIADWLFSTQVDTDGNPLGIGLSIWRFNIGAGSAIQGQDSGIPSDWKRSECFQNADGTYDWTRQQGQRWFLQAAKARGVKQFLAFPYSPPIHMTNNGLACLTEPQTNYNIAPGKSGDFAVFLAETLKQLKDNDGIEFSYLSPFNEPQYKWNLEGVEGSPATNKNMSDLTKLISAELNARSLSTEIVLGEAGMVSYLYGSPDDAIETDNQITDFWSQDSPLSIDNLPNVSKTISSHSYWSVWPLQTLISQRRELFAAVKSIPGLKYWQSEYCILENPGTAELPNGDGNKRDLGMQTALFVARIIHNDLVVANAASWQWWTAITRADYKDGLVYLDDGTDNGNESNDQYCRTDGYVRDSKLMWALGNYSYFIRPGMVRVDVANQDDLTAAKSVMVSAYKDSEAKKIVVVAVNMTAADCKSKFETTDFLASDTLIPYVTSEKFNLAKCEAVSATGFTIPARSVVTYVGELK